VRQTAAILFFPLIPWLWPGTLAAAESSDLVEMRTVRSLAAETAEVFRLQAERRVNAIYARTMTENAVDQLHDLDQSAGGEGAALHRAIAETVAALNHQDSAALRAIAQRLFIMAGPRGPAD